MPDAAAIAGDLVAALNARDYAAIAALCDEDVALSGIGAGSDQGREALRERLARRFAADAGPDLLTARRFDRHFHQA